MRLLGFFILLIFIASCDGNNEPYEDIPQEDQQTTTNALLEVVIPSNFPDPTYELNENPPTEKGFLLGKKLFYDGRLASDGVVSCGFCHIQAFAFTHHTHIVSHGVDGQLGKRNAQPLQNMAFMDEFTWDGAAVHLDAQPIIPITSEVEMNETFGSIIAKLQADPEYVALFGEAFDNGQIDPDNILKALSQFMVMMISGETKFDRFDRNDGTTLTTEELAGLALFEANCASCHGGILFTDQSYRNNGLALNPELNDIGRERVTGNPEDRQKFKVPSLRNIEVTFPYMHDGRIGTLADVLAFYNNGMQDSPTLDPIFRQADGSIGIALTADEQAKIIVFLKTLTDDNFLFDSRFSEF
jgi:cytochrome c peroxidase